MFKKILIIFAVFLGVVVVIILKQPSDFRYSRSDRMKAPSGTIFSHVNDLKRWESWSPWTKMDPNAKITYEGPVAGVGAKMRWDGNMQVGAGSMTIQKSRANEFIQIQLDFLKPMKGTNLAEFTFTPEGPETLVTWTITGKNNFVAKAMGLVIDCEKMIGGHFETGLTNLKTLVESSAT